MSERLEHWRKKYAGGRVDVLDGGHRIGIRPAREGACWMEVMRASGRVIWVGDFEPIIFCDYSNRDLIDWLKWIVSAYLPSPSYGAEKIEIGMSCWATAAQQVADSPLRDLERARGQAEEWLDEWLEESHEEGEEPDKKDQEAHSMAVDAVQHSETIQEVYQAVMEVCPDAFEASFGAKIPDGLWRAIAASEVILAHLEAAASQPGDAP